MDVAEMNLEEICSELDSLAVRMLRLMKEYIDFKFTIEDHIKTGSFHLAKSRYIMGNKSVSSLQLPTEDSNDLLASTTVLCKENSDSTDLLTLELNRLNLSDVNKVNDNEKLRKRNAKKSEDNDSAENDSNRNIPVQDPMKWFGVLVPQDMRHAQTNFNKAIEQVVGCANIQLEILSIVEKYKKCLQKKQELIKRN